MQLVAKTLLGEYASQFEDLDAVGMARHLTSRGVSRLLDRFTAPTPALRDASWQAAALTFREDRLVDSLARRLRRLVKDEGVDPLRALSLCQDHALAAARRARGAGRARAVQPHGRDAPTSRSCRPLRDLYDAVGARARPRLVARARLLRHRHVQGAGRPR